ncbi:hypothetical protein [Agromyces kandeliae]|uniref:Uncharacterized protein n=1 Tax=Agromyces kandeliae TaxID=2666141 RepID=A0A6L5R3H7_9MICO|nr:hypothetical protein [Agromyces kandeliae]MRX44502.1 hypothetical protein [Agromyces kandeliae]
MPDFPWFLAWMQDAIAWEWVRTALAAFIGAVLGGIFTLRAQANASRDQAERDSVARENQLMHARRVAVEKDMQDLHEKFVKLVAAVDTSPQTILHMVGQEPWAPLWKEIWTYDTRIGMRSQADLIPVAEVRSQVVQIVEFLNDARDHSWESAWHGAPERSLRRLAGQLAAEGAETMAAYLRHDDHRTRRTRLLSNLQREAAEYSAWESHEVERSELEAEQWYENATPQERAEADANFAEFFTRPRGEAPDDREDLSPNPAARPPGEAHGRPRSIWVRWFPGYGQYLR